MSPRSERILEFVTRFPGRDDDEISKSLAIRPRQTVNQICRALEATGRVRRAPGPLGKIANYPVDRHSAGAARSAVAEPDLEGESFAVVATRPALTADALQRAGFTLAGEWTTKAGQLAPDRRPPTEPGVYAFVLDGAARYVGVATMGLAKRLHFYGRPGATQVTSQRLNALLLEAVGAGQSVRIYAASPAPGNWNGLPVSIAAGLELGLIERFDLPWNIRGARQATTAAPTEPPSSQRRC